jgi:uncharacterized damage-inducible protein DinB
MVADERASLIGFLEYQRQTLLMKCAGLTAEQLRQKAVAPSALSLLGLVRHLANVERAWFHNFVDGDPVPPYWGLRPDGMRVEFEVDEADRDAAFEIWLKACARSRDIVEAAESLDVVVDDGEDTCSLRYVIAHMIEEYARHNGHADLLRERIDGSTGL